MSDAQQRPTESHLLLNICMIVLETIYSFVLKHDRVVRVQAKKFVDQHIVVKVNSYIPYFDFYVQFTTKGILFDVQAPEKAVDLTLSSTLLDLLQAFLFGNRRSMHKMRIEGDDTVLKDELRDLVLHFSAPNFSQTGNSGSQIQMMMLKPLHQESVLPLFWKKSTNSVLKSIVYKLK